MKKIISALFLFFVFIPFNVWASVLTTPISLEVYLDENTKNANEWIHWWIVSISSANLLNSSTPISDTIWQSKIMIVVNAWTDTVWQISVTWDTIDRNSQVVTSSDVNVITIDWLSSDSSSTDSNWNWIHGFAWAYITSNWFMWNVTIDTVNVDFSDVDIYQISFEQFNDTSELTLDSFDTTFTVTNWNAYIDEYLYSVFVSWWKVTVSSEASHHLSQADSVAWTYYRLRASDINKPLNWTTDWVFQDTFFWPSSLSYFEWYTSKIWANTETTITTAPLLADNWWIQPEYEFLRQNELYNFYEIELTALLLLTLMVFVKKYSFWWRTTLKSFK